MNEALEKLKERLSSPRLRAPTTIKSYLETGKRFLTLLGDGKEPTDSDFRRYFIHRREHNISERTLRTEFFHLKKLALSNNWDWNFTADDAPYSEEEPFQPPLMPDDIEKLIKAQHLYRKSERFFLAVSTTWGCRREEMSRIKKRDYDTESILIRTAKHGRRVRHLIPDVLKPVFEAYRPRQHNPATLSYMFHRICRQAGVKVEKGYGWHSVRRLVVTCLFAACGRHNLDPTLVADYLGWSKRSMGSFFTGSAMAGVYRHPEVLSSDPFYTDLVLNPVHPLLPFWEAATSKKRARKKE